MSQAEFDDEFDRAFFVDPNLDTSKSNEDDNDEDDYFDMYDEIDTDMSLTEKKVKEEEVEDIDDETFYANTLDFAYTI